MHREALFDWSRPLPPAVEDSTSYHIPQAQSHPRFAAAGRMVTALVLQSLLLSFKQSPSPFTG